MKTLHMVAFVLLLVGGLNLGLAALGYNVVEMLLGAGSTLVTGVYLLVGAAALLEIFSHRGNCRVCVKQAA